MICLFSIKLKKNWIKLYFDLFKDILPVILKCLEKLIFVINKELPKFELIWMKFETRKEE
jgi:hypothetical protein